MSKYVRIIILLCFFVSGLTYAQSVMVRYIGNMGVHIKYQDTQLLIDGLHLPYRSEYLAPPTKLLDSLTYNLGDFNTTIALFTHQHNDHFNETIVDKFLQTNVKRFIIAPIQVCNKLNPRFNSQIKSSDVIQFFQAADHVTITPFPIKHTWPVRNSNIKNHAFIIQLESKRIVHLGDADCSRDALLESGIGNQTYNVAIVPIWFFGSEYYQEALKYVIAKKYIVTHISPISSTFIEQVKKNIIKSGVDGILFRRIGDQITF